jgi:hypothetical protein
MQDHDVDTHPGSVPDERGGSNGSGLLLSAPVNVSKKRVPKLVMSWVREGRAAAAVRFGEGEGRLLVAEPEDPRSMQVAINKLRRQTGLGLPPDDVVEIKALVMRAFDEADLVGIRGSDSFNEEHKLWVARIEQVFSERLAGGRKQAYVSHCLFNNDLRDALPTLLEGQRRISVVSCRDVRHVFEDDLGVPDVNVYQVPSQYVMRRVDDPYEAVLHDVPIWPDFYRRLRSDIRVRHPGEIFLIGAGILGKELCIRVKELGGIALDLGSCLDGLAGKVTRGPGRPEPYRPG